MKKLLLPLGLTIVAAFASHASIAANAVQVEGQPLAANAKRLLQALQFLGAPLPQETSQKLQAAIKARDAAAIQKILDPHVLVHVRLSPEARVKAARGKGKAILQQGGYTPVILKILNESSGIDE